MKWGSVLPQTHIFKVIPDGVRLKSRVTGKPWIIRSSISPMNLQIYHTVMNYSEG